MDAHPDPYILYGMMFLVGLPLDPITSSHLPLPANMIVQPMAIGLCFKPPLDFLLSHSDP